MLFKPEQKTEEWLPDTSPLSSQSFCLLLENLTFFERKNEKEVKCWERKFSHEKYIAADWESEWKSCHEYGWIRSVAKMEVEFKITAYGATQYKAHLYGSPKLNAHYYKSLAASHE